MSSTRASMRRSPLSRMAAGTAQARCWVRLTRSCTDFPKARGCVIPGCAERKPRALRFRIGLVPVCNDEHPTKEKGPTRVGPVSDCCVRSGPDDPGGLGAEESETERTGPTQYALLPI